MDNHIETLLDSSNFEGNDNTLNLFKEGDIDLRTDLTWEELLVMEQMRQIDNVITDKGIANCTLYGDFIVNYKKLKVSKDRLSRIEFKDTNLKDRFREHVQEFANMGNILGAKK